MPTPRSALPHTKPFVQQDTLLLRRCLHLSSYQTRLAHLRPVLYLGSGAVEPDGRQREEEAARCWTAPLPPHRFTARWSWTDP